VDPAHSVQDNSVTRATLSLTLLVITFAERVYFMREQMKSWREVFFALFCFCCGRGNKNNKEPDSRELEDLGGRVADTSRATGSRSSGRVIGGRRESKGGKRRSK
jgi:hypothetical protein